MRNFWIGAALALGSLLVFSAGSPAQAPAQGAPKAKTSNEPFDPHDFTGVWAGASIASLMREQPPMTAWGLARYKEARTNTSDPPAIGADDNDPILRCEPTGIPRMYSFAHPISFMQDKDKIVQLFEADRIFRIFFLNRQHPVHGDTLWFGDSIAHWEGNTLVVDTTNFNDRSWLDTAGHPHSEQLHLIERFTRTDHDHLQDDITIDDPMAYTKTWGGQKIWTLQGPKYELDEYVCSPSDEQQVIQKVMEPEAAPKK